MVDNRCETYPAAPSVTAPVWTLYWSANAFAEMFDEALSHAFWTRLFLALLSVTVPAVKSNHAAEKR